MFDQQQLSIDRCPACGEFLTAGRKNKRFHNSACRTRYWRAKKLIIEHSVTAQRYVIDMMKYADDRVVGRDVFTCLYDIAMTLLQEPCGVASVVAALKMHEEAYVAE